MAPPRGPPCEALRRRWGIGEARVDELRAAPITPITDVSLGLMPPTSSKPHASLHGAEPSNTAGAPTSLSTIAAASELTTPSAGEAGGKPGGEVGGAGAAGGAAGAATVVRVVPAGATVASALPAASVKVVGAPLTMASPAPTASTVASAAAARVTYGGPMSAAAETSVRRAIEQYGERLRASGAAEPWRLVEHLGDELLDEVLTSCAQTLLSAADECVEAIAADEFQVASPSS